MKQLSCLSIVIAQQVKGGIGLLFYEAKKFENQARASSLRSPAPSPSARWMATALRRRGAQGLLQVCEPCDRNGHRRSSAMKSCLKHGDIELPESLFRGGHHRLRGNCHCCVHDQIGRCKSGCGLNGNASLRKRACFANVDVKNILKNRRSQEYE